MMKYLFVIGFIFCAWISVGQHTTSLKGIIVDHHNQPVPYAHLSLQGTGMGVVSNESGQFNFQFPTSSCGGKMVVSCMGFETINFPITCLDNQPIKLMLAEKVVQLNEVAVMAYTANKLVELVIANLNKNYQLDSVNYTFFNRITEQSIDGPVLLEEAVFDLYHQANSRPEFYLQKVRGKGFGQLGEQRFEDSRLHGIHSTESHILLRYLPDFLKKRQMKKYTYTILDTRLINGMSYTIISVNSDNYLQGGEMWVNNQNYGIRYLKKTYQDESWPKVSKLNTFQESHYTCVDDQWFFSHGRRSYVWAFEEDGLQLKVKQLTVATERTPRRAFHKSKEMGLMVQMVNDFSGDFDDTFWEDFNFIPLDSVFENAIRDHKK